MRVVNWRVKVNAAMTVPRFLAILLATQAIRKVRKWRDRTKNADAQTRS